MKKSIIEEIFAGERGWYETIKESKEYNEILGKASDLSEELAEELTEKQKTLFEKLCLKQFELISEAALVYFTEGFKIGVRIGVECMDD